MRTDPGTFERSKMGHLGLSIRFEHTHLDIMIAEMPDDLGRVKIRDGDKGILARFEHAGFI
jgi:hypothetical protein